MDDLISRKALLAEYDKAHIGEPGNARKLIENAPAVQQWISVKDRLPEEKQRVLTVDDSGYVVVNCISLRFGGWFNDAFGGRRTTHWMPLPQPPKGE